MLPGGPLGTGGGSGSGNATSIGGIPVDTTGIAMGNALLYDGASLIPAPTEDGLTQPGVGSDHLEAGAALANIGAGNLTATYLATGAAASNLGSPGGALAGSWPSPTLGANAVASSTAIAANAVRGTKIDPGTTFLTNIGMQGRNGVGACTLTGAAIGDVVLSVAFHYGTPTAAAPNWETTITATNQLQQGAAIDSSAAYYSVLLLKRA